MTKEELRNYVNSLPFQTEISYDIYSGLIEAIDALEQDKELISVRQELLDRGDEVISFRQLVERFDRVEEEYKGVPWNLKQIYNNFNILIGEKSCRNAISRSDMLDAIGHGTIYTSEELQKIIKDLPSVSPQVKTAHWIDTGSGQMCSGCSEIQYGHDNFRHFCASCGAKMDEVEDRKK